MSKKFKVVLSILAVVSVITCLGIAVAADPTAGESAISTMVGTDGVITGALTDFNASNLGTILVAALGITVALVLAWFAYRFITKRVSKAMRKGSL